MTNEIEYRIKIKNGNIEIEVQGDKVWVEAKFKELSEEIQSTKPIGPTPPIPTPIKLPNSLQGLFRKAKEPRKFSDQVLLFTYWLSKTKNMDTVNTTDMNGCFDKAKLKKPANMTDIMRKIDDNYFLEAAEKDGKKAYKLSLDGEKYVEKMLSGK